MKNYSTGTITYAAAFEMNSECDKIVGLVQEVYLNWDLDFEFTSLE